MLKGLSERNTLWGCVPAIKETLQPSRMLLFRYEKTGASIKKGEAGSGRRGILRLANK